VGFVTVGCVGEITATTRPQAASPSVLVALCGNLNARAMPAHVPALIVLLASACWVRPVARATHALVALARPWEVTWGERSQPPLPLRRCCLVGAHWLEVLFTCFLMRMCACLCVCARGQAAASAAPAGAGAGAPAVAAPAAAAAPAHEHIEEDDEFEEFEDESAYLPPTACPGPWSLVPGRQVASC
jgi:hypothetical protein